MKQAHLAYLAEYMGKALFGNSLVMGEGPYEVIETTWSARCLQDMENGMDMDDITAWSNTSTYEFAFTETHMHDVSDMSRSTVFHIVPLGGVFYTYCAENNSLYIITLDVNQNWANSMYIKHRS